MTREEKLFADALALPPTERVAFIESECANDADLRTRLLALLAAHDASEEFLSDSPLSRVAHLEEAPGDRIGHYTLLRKLGEGGCGRVYLAEQHEPVRRQVALKVVKLGMDTREIIARFEAERQALALMEHPNIARVYDAGATEAGRPFFVMEFVDGVPITQFCDAQNLPVRDRLDLFVGLCQALQHAHQKGVIHRDIKPSNILVALQDGVPTPKIIDFGIAKATQGRLTEHTLITRFEQVVGTPAYMSPEQADLRETDIDTRSDIYSLGVLLYELLSGRPPFDPKSLLQAGIAEIRRIIRETEPPRPSTVVSTLGLADRTIIAQHRRASPTRLPSELRGDLDWIVMRCLEKQRDRRYGTAAELAEDIRRHLRSEPVQARPPNAAYRARRFVRRHRMACAAAAAVALSLMAGAVVSTWQAIRATRAEHATRLERDAAQAAQRAEAVARADAQRRQEQAEALLTFMLGDFRAELKKLGKLSLLDAIADKAMSHFSALDPKDLTDTALNQQARALTQIGEIRLDQARYADAVQAFETAYQRTAALCARHPQNADMLFERAQAEFWIGFAARRRGDFKTTREWLTRYRDSALALRVLEGPTKRATTEVISGLRNLAVVDYDTDDLAAAEQGFKNERLALERQLASASDDSTLQGKLAEVIFWQGAVAEKDGRYSDAIAYYRDMAERIRTLHTSESMVAKWRYRLAEVQGHIARILSITGRKDEAVARFQDALTFLEATPEPANQQWHSVDLAMQLEQAIVLVSLGRAPDHERIVRLRSSLNALIAQQPQSRPTSRMKAMLLMLETRIGLVSTEQRLSLVQQARSVLSPFVGGTTVDSMLEGEFARACVLEGRIEADAGRPERARACWLTVLSLLERRAANSRDWRVLDPLAQAMILLSREDSAQPLIETLKRCGYQPIDPDAASTLRLNP